MVLFKVELETRNYTKTKNKMEYTKTWYDGTIVGNVQNPKGIDIHNIKEGGFSAGSMVIYCEDRLDIQNENTQTNNTFVLSPHGVWLEVVQELFYQNQGALKVLNHYKYIAEPRTLSEVGLK